MKFSSKAEVLYKLRNEKKFKLIPKLKIFKLSDYQKNQNKIINKIKKSFKTKIAIRSSAINEDGNFFSNAGKYKSNINVDTKNSLSLNTKLKDVTNSLKKNNKNLFLLVMNKIFVLIFLLSFVLAIIDIFIIDIKSILINFFLNISL